MTTLFNYDPYFDDFDEDKNFMRVLFRPGYSIQARELTQLQTILNNQIEKFGNHIFKSGSPIVGGKVSLDDKAYYIILNSQYDNQDIVPSDFLNKTITSFSSSKSVRAKVIAVDTSTSNPILVLKYLSGDVFSEEDVIKISGQNTYAQLKATNAVGRSYIASIQEGVYYFKGQFVKVTPQFLVLTLQYKIGYNTSTVNEQPSYKIGIEFVDAIIDEIDDTSLLDPAQGSFNYQAPGSVRYQVQTSLSKRTLDSADESSFFEVIRLVNGIKTKEIDYPIYSEIEKTLARRTYDESGNYTVDPFVISLEEGDSANGYFNVVLDPGKAYVGGYEFQTIAPTTLTLDRARDTSSVNDYDIPTNYSSSLTLESIYGTMDISSYPLIDIHSVPSANINVSTAAAYTSTKIGTLRANMMKYNDSTNSNIGNTHSYIVNVFDVTATSITGTIPSSGSDTSNIALPTSFSSAAPNNTYADMYFKITDAGGSSIAPIKIASSNTLSRTITLSQALPFVPASNTFSIDSDIKTAKSVSVKNGSSLSFYGNVNADSKDSTTGFTFITEPQDSSLIFDLPYDAIKAGTISNLDLYAKKVYSNKLSGGDGVVTITTEGTDTFAFAGTPGTLSDSLILSNIICFIRSDSVANSSHGIAPGYPVSLANNLFTVTAVSSTTIEIDFNVVGVKADFIITTKVNNADNSSTGAIRGKQMLPLTSGADLHAKVPYQLGGTNTLAAANSTTRTAFTGGVVFEDIGSTFFDGTSILADLRTPGKTVSLQVPDVYEIVRITDSKSLSANVTTAMLTNSSYDVTSNYEFDNGQKKTHYDHATIKLRRGYSSPKGKLYVQYRYLKHSSAPSPQIDGLFTVDSYLKTDSNMTYDDISVFTNKEDSKLVQLRSAFDFRPTRAIGGDTLSGAINPDPSYTAKLNYDYYLGRIDQVVVKPSREFAVIKGKSSVNPSSPPIERDDMLIYTLSIPAYTEDIKQVKADFNSNRRYTMKDIGSFETRLKQLEYYVSLNSLEKNAAATKILDNNGLERSKYGILVDNFTSKDSQAKYSDVGYDNRCLVENGELKSASLMRTFKMKVIPDACSGAFKLVGTNEKKSMILNYSTIDFAGQPYATKAISVAGALYATFKGSMRLFPEFVGDVDTGTTAKVTLNSLQGLDNAFNFINDAFKYIADKNVSWSADKNSPFAQTVDTSWYTTKSVTTTQNNVSLGGNWFGNIQTTTDQTFIPVGADIKQKQLTQSTSQVDTGTFVTDLAIQPYVKPRQIIFNCQGLKPNTSFYHFFDSTDVNSYVVVPNKVTLNTSSAFASGEEILIANTTSDLAANLTSYLAGGSNYSLATVTNNETGTNVVYIVNETGKPLASKYAISLDSGNVAIISSVTEHKSGISRGLTSNTITLASDAPSVDISGNTVTLVRSVNSEEGVGEQCLVVSYNTTTKVATVETDIASDITTNYTYSIGDNKSNILGQVSGAFYPPVATFRSGERAFRVTESFNNTYDADAISFAEHTYVASGVKLDKTTLVDTVYNIGVDTKVAGKTTSTTLVSSKSSSVITAKWYSPPPSDPLAQTFYVDPQVYPNGLFLASAGLYFKTTDDSNLPVTIQIRPTVNGVPHSDFWYPESVVVKYPSEVNVSNNPAFTTSSSRTTFEFSSPVFLKPGMYAIVVLTDSPDYSLWVAEKGATTTRNEFVGLNPYIGTLYKSQNSMEYVPFINEDMMFVLNRCVFTKNSTASFVLKSPEMSNTVNVDKFRLIETALSPMNNSPITANHYFKSKSVDGTMETSYREFIPHVTYSMDVDDVYSVGYRRKILETQGDFTVKVDMSTTDDTVSPLISLESMYLNAWENFVDNGEISSDNFNIIEAGTGYSNSNTVVVTSSSGSGAEINLMVDGSGSIIGFDVVNSGSGYLDDFTISIDSNTGTGASVSLNSEFDSSGGPCDARYITKPITLTQGFDAGDLRVFLAANKQGNSEVSVFCKLLSSSDSTDFKDRPYQKLVCVNPTTTPSKDGNDFREYEYRPSATVNSITYTSDDGGTYDTFNTFAIKIVMTSNDPAITPKVKDLRIIALPAE